MAKCAIEKENEELLHKKTSWFNRMTDSIADIAFSGIGEAYCLHRAVYPLLESFRQYTQIVEKILKEPSYETLFPNFSKLSRLQAETKYFKALVSDWRKNNKKCFPNVDYLLVCCINFTFSNRLLIATPLTYLTTECHTNILEEFKKTFPDFKQKIDSLF